jgi:hypothetical protein
MGNLRLMDAKLSESTASQGRVAELHARLNGVLRALDGAELHGAAAYVSMALDTMLRDHPELNPTH